MRIIRKCLIVILIFVAILSMCVVINKEFINNNLANSEEYESKALYVWNLTDDREVLRLNENQKLKQASLVKIMTVYEGLKTVEDISSLAPIDVPSYQEMVRNNASMAGFLGYETTTFRDLMYGCILPSGGECANSLAINAAGSVNAFVEKMNVRAKEIGLKNTHYINVDGFDAEGQYSTAKDTAMLLRTALKDGDFRAIFTRKEYRSSPTNIHPGGVYMKSTVFSRLERYAPNYMQDGFQILGGKSGTTNGAGLCWATLAEKNGKEYIVVTLGAPFELGGKNNYGQVVDTLKILREIDEPEE